MKMDNFSLGLKDNNYKIVFLHPYDKNNCISTLTYIFQLNPKLLLQSELDKILLVTYHCLKGVHLLNPLGDITVCLNAIDTDQYIIFDGKYQIRPFDCWFCKCLILASLKHCNTLFENKCDCSERKIILQHSLKNFLPDKWESLHLLRLIANLADSLHNEIDIPIAIDLIKCAQTAALSPLNGFKQYAEEISEKVIFFITSGGHLKCSDIDFFPLKGLPTIKLEPSFLSVTPNSPLFQISVTRVIEMFSNNIENREGGSLYKILLNRLLVDFDMWKETIWPQFFNKFQTMDCEGEFFQSLLKYWIPQSVASYQHKLHYLASISSIPDLLKGYIFLETRKKHCIETYSEGDVLLLTLLFSQENTRSVAFQIVCGHLKKKTVPTLDELNFVWQFLFEQSDALNREEVQVLQKFLNHVATIIANPTIKEEYLNHLKKLLKKLLTLGFSLLKTNRESLGAQILNILSNLASLTRLELGEKPNDDLVLLVQQLNSPIFAKSVEQILAETRVVHPQVIDLAVRLVDVPHIFTNEFLIGFIEKVSNQLSVKASDCVKNVSRFMIATNIKQNNHENTNNLRKILYKNLMTIFKNDLAKYVFPKDIFKSVLLLDALNQTSDVSNDVSDLEGIHALCFPVVAKILQQYRQDAGFVTDPLASNKMEKILEALYNNICEYLLKDRNIWTNVDRMKLMELLVQVIENSSMRRPTMTSANLLIRAATNTDIKRHLNQEASVQQTLMEKEIKNDLDSFSIRLLHRTLLKLEQVAAVQNLTIRKNPETRLVLHALCVSDSSPQKYFLTWTLNHLLKLLSSKDSTDSTKSSALHCTEILMSDKAMYSYTLKYSPTVILVCVDHFENRNWVVRNASIQLAKVIIDRFLGVQIGHNNRTKSMDDLFQLFPQLALPFFQTITKKPLTDSALAVLQFFAESQVKALPYSTQISLVTREAFLSIFALLIQENSNFYGLLATRAYVSLCINCDIPYIIPHIVNFILDNFTIIRIKHTIKNFMLLLQELHDKYVESILDKPEKPDGFYRIHDSLRELTKFLSRFNNCDQFNCLLIKIHSMHTILSRFRQGGFDLNDYRQRMWLHNYVPFLVINTNLTDLANVLEVVFSQQVLECLQVKILTILVDRFVKEMLSKTDQIIKILVRKVLTVENTRNHLLMCYFKVILLLLERYNSFPIEDLLDEIRSQYSDVTLDTYKMFLFVVILSMAKERTDADKIFAKSAMKHVQLLHFNDDDLTENVSEILQYLYKNSNCLCDRKRILKLALLLVIEHGLWHFVVFITKSNISSPIRALQKIINSRFLSIFFDSDILAYEFVIEFYNVVCQDNDKKIDDNGTYYVAEDDVFIDKICIVRIIMKCLYELHQNISIIPHNLVVLQGTNKINL